MAERVRAWARRAAFVLVPAVALYYLVLGGEYGAFDLRELEASRASAVHRVDSLQLVVDSLAARADSLARDTLAIERLARERYGFLRDGERLFRFVPPREGVRGPPRPAEPERGSGVDPSGGEE